jgi:hypothetical protein
VKVRYDEGVAIHIGPEPCVAVRKDVDEASVGDAQQLDARVEVLSGPQGTTVSVTHATFVKMRQAAWRAADVMQPLIPGHA